MAQRMRVRPGQAVWVGALAVLCGGLAGCLDADKDKRPRGPPPMAKGSTGINPQPGAMSRVGPPGATAGMNSNPYAPNTSPGGITTATGQLPPGYNGQTGPYYDPMAKANPNSTGMTPV